MDYKSSFHAVLATVRPLMKGTRNLGEFTAGLIDMGLVPRGTVYGEKTALEMRKSATWKGYANGSDQLPTVLASELAGRWDQFRFASNVSQAYEESALNDLADRLHDLDESINKGNVTEGLGQLFYKVFTEAAGETAAVTEPLTLVDKADRSASRTLTRRRIASGLATARSRYRRSIPHRTQFSLLSWGMFRRSWPRIAKTKPVPALRCSWTTSRRVWFNTSKNSAKRSTVPNGYEKHRGTASTMGGHCLTSSWKRCTRESPTPTCVSTPTDSNASSRHWLKQPQSNSTVSGSTRSLT